ncbi:methyl-accepting chemotaxis protein [Hahella sp. CCB-MM4]|uniref:methyl-accepting chemotaxis protein n=1 Tax=Hahella sp. (strain CCB-MM4) TaxID=1926491 RepID=UPI000B9B64EE|nr:methyl-accepting chemotaxis protein [Hahella sp. CCB-MM4]OZG71384.1 methyl-accepting chemotaxis protein [Hahella sp. CCB-MM4]
MKNLLSLFKSRLLMPVFLVLIAAVALQILINTWLTQSQVQGLAEQIQRDLNDSTATVNAELKVAEKAVLERLQSMRSDAASQLGQSLNKALTETQTKIESDIKASMTTNAQNLADIVAAVAAPSIWDRDVPVLTSLAEMADANESVVFAGFYDQYGERLTRYVDRTDERLKELVSKGTGKGSLGKAINAAENDPSIIIITSDISPNEVSIGKFIMGLSTDRIDREMQVLKGEFEQLTTQSQQAVSTILDEQSGQVSSRLAQSLAQTEKTSTEASTQVLETIDGGANQIIASLFMTAFMLGIALFIVIALMLGVRVLLKVNVLKSAIWDIAEGEADLTQRANVRGKDEISHMAEGLNQFIARIQNIIIEVAKSAQAATLKAGELTANSDQASSAVNKQKQEIDQISSAITEMSASIQQVAENVQYVANDVDHVNAETKATATISRRVSGTLSAMVSEVEAAATVVRKLDHQSQEIGSVLTVIKSIAEQTNLLALNAAIEAARAGESGRGFAVVADEVRNLASKTQQSTTEIEDIITQLQLGSEEAVAAIENASQKVQVSTESFREADQNLENIQNLVSNLHGRATEIASVAEEQSAVSEEITQNVTHIADSAETTATAMHKAEQASTDISQQIKALEVQASQFKV